MSWQSYVDSNLLGTGSVQKAAIFGLDGSQWAISSGFAVSHTLYFLDNLLQLLVIICVMIYSFYSNVTIRAWFVDRYPSKKQWMS